MSELTSPQADEQSSYEPSNLEIIRSAADAYAKHPSASNRLALLIALENEFEELDEELDLDVDEQRWLDEGGAN